MEIALLVAILAVLASGLYTATTFNRRTRRNTAPMIDHAVSDISEQIKMTADNLRLQLRALTDDLHHDRDEQRLDGRKIQGRLDHTDSRISDVASQFSAELEAIERLGEQIGARQGQFSGHLQQLDDEVAQLGESLVQQSARSQQADETLPALLRGPEAPGTVSRPSLIILTHAESKDVLQSRRRYLKGQCPESVQVGEPFSLLVSIVTTGLPSAGLKPFDVPPEGRDVLLVVHAPRLRVLGHQRMTVHVPPAGDSEPVMFELRADTAGPQPVSVTAWLGGSYLGELLVEVTAEQDGPSGTNHDVLAEIATEPTDGAVSLVVRYDPGQNAYRFEFRDEDNPEEVISHLAYEPGPQVEQLVAGLDELAKGRSGYSAAQARDYLVNAGAGLWQELIPERLREQFWERQHRIRQLTILADKDAVPWELLYPMDPGHDAGFLVEQFPVTRAVFGRRPIRRLSLRPARFVLPDKSLPEAGAEIEAMRRLLDPGHSPDAVIAALTPLQELIRTGDFGLLHFACHNRFDPADGSSIMLDHVPFKLTHMTTAAINHALADSAPTVFINACRTAGLTARYNRLDGWASKFLEAGAAVFIGSLWAVRDTTGREFASELYSHLRAGFSLGKALLCARRAAASQPGDPTWLAYTVYGDPSATVSGIDRITTLIKEEYESH